jgi:hypothetical protein
MVLKNVRLLDFNRHRNGSGFFIIEDAAVNPRSLGVFTLLLLNRTLMRCFQNVDKYALHVAWCGEKKKRLPIGQTTYRLDIPASTLQRKILLMYSI